MFDGVSDDVISLREVGPGGAVNMSVAFKLSYWDPREEICVYEDPAHTFVHVDVQFPKIIPLLYVSCGRIF